MSSARADVTPRAGEVQPSEVQVSEVIVKIDGENILLSQDGRHFEELRLGDTREALHLRQLLRNEAPDGRAVTLPVGSMIVASGGATGKGWGWKTGKQPASPPANKENVK